MSYIKDANELLSKKLKKVPNITILVTANVLGICPSIPYKEGLEILKKQNTCYYILIYITMYYYILLYIIHYYILCITTYIYITFLQSVVVIDSLSLKSNIKKVCKKVI